ncbi:putative StAR-related lipid transfer protein 10 [Monocercomonoides exilis]|uniref:putative StAR-related lipid transfer protein 10 n=1 Tax=Monocercomonoides exilis TaxID=2049356 RepID=UPI003559E406|nr:putative StAR-related lipid transfer protein 10 [Monocercomonoides exilis]|eukprot:MONOS_14654.1-p1 / transcript=MONOS_14654.1 / gene=MONOS_14654 / organism=Monocercomonoides_exilis_PA203 / gene_product=unspecified product / transcript_product=unspecified product / location=Mono_scaffold01042:16180-16990(-) / protein_length=235 / sequence_SO=supercontig / SO=protein_coding / is_pseudo=false
MLASKSIKMSKEQVSTFPNADELLDRMRKMSEDESLWKKSKTDSGVDIFEGKVSTKYRQFRGVGYVDQPLATMVSVVKDAEKRKQWNEQMMGNEVVEDISEHVKVIHSKFNGGAASNRDFCVFYTDHLSDTEYIDAQTSIIHEKCPVMKGFVRATCLISGTRMIAESPTRTKVFYLGQVDLGGMVPSFVANIVNMKQPLCIARMRDFAMKDAASSSSVPSSASTSPQEEKQNEEK